jgi:hypothetical protein
MHSAMKLFDTLKSRVFKDAGLPPPEFLKYWESAMEYTPDAGYLQTREKWWLFVYGEEMSRHSKNVELFYDLEPACGARTFENFALWKSMEGTASYPIAMEKKLPVEDLHWFKTKHDVPWAKIRGELYLVPPQVLFKLDNYRRNGVVCERKRTHIIIPYRHQNYGGVRMNKDIKAWMYTGKLDYWSDLIQDGVQHNMFKPVRSFDPKDQGSIGKKYYYFTLAECNPTFK